MDSPLEDIESGGGGRPSVRRTRPADPTTVRRLLLAFFDREARDLPWRRTDDPYAIWVSEVMLQQTRVDTVVPYFERWMSRYPDVDALARADVDDVLKAWEGLGYYRRARMLHRAAGVVRDRLGGQVPRTAEALEELPGVGAYTAGAVASIAFGEAVPAVDGNARRVLARLHDLPDPGAAELRELAGALVGTERPGDVNQAIMELGATVCTPRGPRCGSCPVRDHCLARARGVQEERPRKQDRKPVPRVDIGVAVLLRHDTGDEPRLFLVRRPPGGLLGGLWEFPGKETADGETAGDAALRAAGRVVGDRAPRGWTRLGVVEHAYSHFVGRYHPFLLRVDAARDPGPGGGGEGWFTAAALDDLALPVAQRRIAEVAARETPGAG